MVYYGAVKLFERAWNSPFWPNHTLEPLHAWTQWSDQFQLAIIAKENLDLESLHGPEIPEMQIPIL